MTRKGQTSIEPYQLQMGDVFTLAMSRERYQTFRETCQKIGGKTEEDKSKNCPWWDDDLIAALKWGGTYLVIKRTEEAGSVEKHPLAHLDCVPIWREGKPIALRRRFSLKVFDMHYFDGGPVDEVLVRIQRHIEDIRVVID